MTTKSDEATANGSKKLVKREPFGRTAGAHGIRALGCGRSKQQLKVRSAAHPLPVTSGALAAKLPTCTVSSCLFRGKRAEESRRESAQFPVQLARSAFQTLGPKRFGSSEKMNSMRTGSLELTDARTVG
jgi:hypothetical protein